MTSTLLPQDAPENAELARATRGGDTQSIRERVALALFIVVPFLAVIAAIPVAWGGWLGWSDVVIFLLMYTVTLHGITVGFHRLFTHKSFKPNRAVKNTLAILGSMAIQGPVVRWVADHRKHHKFSDRDGTRTARGSTATASRTSARGYCTHTWAGSSTPSRRRNASTRRT